MPGDLQPCASTDSSVRAREPAHPEHRLPPERIRFSARAASPITRASGKKSSITRRWVKNDRLNHAGYLWAFASLTASMGAKAHYRRRRDEHSDWHAAAQRNLFNRLLGQLYHCLKAHAAVRRTCRLPHSVDRCGLTDPLDSR